MPKRPPLLDNFHLRHHRDDHYDDNSGMSGSSRSRQLDVAEESHHSPRSRGIISLADDHPAVDFIDNRLDESFHPAFGRSDVMYNRELNRYVGAERSNNVDVVARRNNDETVALREHSGGGDIVPAIIQVPSQGVDPTREMAFKKDRFLMAVKEYERKTKRKTPIDFGKSRDWEDVLQRVYKTRDEYEGTNTKGFARSLRNGFRSFASAQPTVNNWLRLLPKENLFGSVFCGGVEIIFDAAARLGKMREDTYEALEQIPISIDKATALMAVYEDSKQLQSHISQLYCAVLDVLEHILLWYSHNPARKYLTSVFLGDDYGSALTGRLELLRKMEQKVEGQAAVDQHRRIGAVDQNIKYLVESSNNTQNQAVKMQNMMLQMLNNQEKQNEIFEYIAEQRRARQAEQNRYNKTRARSLENAALLRRALDYDSEIPFQDLEDILRAGFTLSLTEQDRAAWVLQSSRVRAWLVSPRSEILHINCSEDLHATVSPASLFCAMLVHALLQVARPAVTLHWFCGLHPNDEVATMLGNLIGQILDANGIGIDLSTRRPAWCANVNPDDPQLLCHIFTDFLSQQLEVSPVFIVIDGVSFYEDGHRSRDMHATMSQISRLVEDHANIFKLLVTSPTRMDYIQNIGIDAREILDVPQFIDGANQGFNDAALLSVVEGSASNFVEETKQLYDDEDEDTMYEYRRDSRTSLYR